VLTLGTALAALWASPASAQNGANTAYCVDANDRGGYALPVPMKEYAVVLLGNTIRPDRPNNRVVAKATLLFKAPSPFKREVYPMVMDDPNEVMVQCQDDIRSANLPDVFMEILGAGDITDLANRLKALSETSGVVRKAKTAPSWPAFLLFSKNAFQPVEPDRYAGISRLFKNYFKVAADPAFLAGVPFNVKVTSVGDFVTGTHSGTASGPPPAIDQRPADGASQQLGASQQSGVSQQSAPPSQQQAASQQPKNLRGKGAPLAPPVAPAPATTPTAASRPVNLTPTEVKIRFRANQDQWQALLRDPGLIETFNFCDNPSALGGGAYKLACTLRPDRKVPIRVRGFRELLIDPEGAVLDDLLQVAGFSVPYPNNWKRSQSEFVSVPPGPLREILVRRIPLSQGIAGCQTEIAGLSIEDIVTGNLRFPPEPCKPYDVSFSQVTLAPDARIDSGCLAGSNEPVAILNNKVTCWARSGQGGDLKLPAQLVSGFGPVALPVTAGTDAEFNYARLALGLVPVWPYAPGIVEPGESPTYAPRNVQFATDNGVACAAPLDPPNNNRFTLPSLGQAGCNQIPRTMVVTLEQDRGSQNGATVPLEAFRPRFDDSIELAKAQPGVRLISLDQLKLPLPVQFSAEDAKTFVAQFGPEAGNAQFPGVFLFQGDCKGKRNALNGAYVPFNGPFNTQAALGPYKWPIKAAVYDSGEEPLTQCATAVVGGTQGPTPYLTFGLHGARAVGPRRAIVISMSPNLTNRGGTKAVSESLRTFVDQVFAEVARGARLSPINVFLVNGSGELKPLFTAETAAFEPAKVKAQIEQQQENVAPVTPDFKLLRFMPELRKDGAENFDRVTFVMDGSEVTQDNLDVLAGLTNRLKKPDSVNLLITGNCNTWVQQNANITCTPLSPDASQRAEVITRVFAKFIVPTDLQAANPPSDPTPPPRQATPAAPAPPPQPAQKSGPAGPAHNR
jgi:hypothetical protein